jgi:hypothetical protein
VKPVRILGVQVPSPQGLIEQTASDAMATARFVRAAPGQINRLLEVGEEIVRLGNRLVDLGERLDARGAAITSMGAKLDVRGAAINALGEQLDARGAAIGALGEQLDARAEDLLALGNGINELGRQMDARGLEIVDRAGKIVDTGNNLIVALPTLERALEMATPLEGAIDRVGRFVDRLPGGANTRRRPTLGSEPPSASGESTPHRGPAGRSPGNSTGSPPGSTGSSPGSSTGK